MIKSKRELLLHPGVRQAAEVRRPATGFGRWTPKKRCCRHCKPTRTTGRAGWPSGLPGGERPGRPCRTTALRLALQNLETRAALRALSSGCGNCSNAGLSGGADPEPIRSDVAGVDPGRSFWMGSPEGEAGRHTRGPAASRRISGAFYLGICPVTQEQYQRVSGSSPVTSAPAGKGASVRGIDTGPFPVERVSWHDAVEFCRRLSELPLEKAAAGSIGPAHGGEWEYACRAGTTTRSTSAIR